MTEITSRNLPDLGIKPYKRFDADGILTDVLYSFLNGTTVSIKFDINGFASEISYNGRLIPINARLELIDGNLHVIIPTV